MEQCAAYVSSIWKSLSLVAKKCLGKAALHGSWPWKAVKGMLTKSPHNKFPAAQVSVAEALTLFYHKPRSKSVLQWQQTLSMAEHLGSPMSAMICACISGTMRPATRIACMCNGYDTQQSLSWLTKASYGHCPADGIWCAAVSTTKDSPGRMHVSSSTEPRQSTCKGLLGTHCSDNTGLS